MKKKLLTILLSLTLASNAVAVATPHTVIGNTRFDGTYTREEKRLSLRGAGLFRYMVWIRLYAGALYLPADVDTDDVLKNVPKRLELEYFHAIKGEDFGSATYEGIKRNVDRASLDRLRGKIDLLNSLYVDVKPGDRYAITYLPGRGTTLELNGKVLGTIDGPEYAAAVFSIWLGDDPINQKFKSALLGTP